MRGPFRLLVGLGSVSGTPNVTNDKKLYTRRALKPTPTKLPRVLTQGGQFCGEAVVHKFLDLFHGHVKNIPMSAEDASSPPAEGMLHQMGTCHPFFPL